MTMSIARIGRKQTPQQNRVVEELRNSILDGQLKPETKLPSQSELARRFKVSGVTAHLAVARLTREGFLHSRQRAGTFVTERPPHLNNYALVFWNDPVSNSGAHWSRYYMALTNEAIGIQQREGRRMLLFHGVDQHVDGEDRQRLTSYIESRRLGGLIFANTPYELSGTPIVEQPGIPRVSMMGAPGFDFPGVEVDADGWHERALDQMVALGRKRVAVLMVGQISHTDEVLDKLSAERGWVIPQHWRLPVNPSGTTRIVRLLMQLPPNERPNGLVIADDNLVEHALAGLITARVQVPDDVAVVAHCNFPYPPPSVMPITRLGFHIGQGLRACLNLLDRQRRGEAVPKRTTLPALFEEEAVQVVNAPAV